MFDIKSFFLKDLFYYYINIQFNSVYKNEEMDLHVSYKFPNLGRAVYQDTVERDTLTNDIFYIIKSNNDIEFDKEEITVIDSFRRLGFSYTVIYTTDLVDLKDQDKDNIIDIYEGTYIKNEQYLLNAEVVNTLPDLLRFQYEQRLFLRNNLSSIDFLELTSNKLLLYEYLNSDRLMNFTEVFYKPLDEKAKMDNRSVLKIPYTSKTSFRCNQVSSNNTDVDSLCFRDEGYILQRKNLNLDKYIVRCSVVSGDISLVAVLGQGTELGNSSMALSDFRFPGNKGYTDMLQPYTDQIRELCNKAFISVNKFINAYIHKRKVEMDMFIDIVNDTYKIKVDPFDPHVRNVVLNDTFKTSVQIEASFSSSLKIAKKLILNNLLITEKRLMTSGIKIKINRLIILVDESIISYGKRVGKAIPKQMNEYYMRFDMVLPDKTRFKDLTITDVSAMVSGFGIPGFTKRLKLNQFGLRAHMLTETVRLNIGRIIV